jgi:hypothetical protein
MNFFANLFVFGSVAIYASLLLHPSRAHVQLMHEEQNKAMKSHTHAADGSVNGIRGWY